MTSIKHIFESRGLSTFFSMILYPENWVLTTSTVSLAFWWIQQIENITKTLEGWRRIRWWYVFHWFIFYSFAVGWLISWPKVIASFKAAHSTIGLPLWERLTAGGEGDNRGWDGWMTSLTQWTWVWVDSGSWWWTGRPGMLWFMGSQRVGHDWATELNCGSAGKESACNTGELGWIPGLGRSPV